MNDDERTAWRVGFVCGIIATLIVWFGVSDLVENSKVNGGYLTFRRNIYSVKLATDMNKIRLDTQKSLSPTPKPEQVK